ncbi:predicted protein [Arabidopsis lyrata subsp. lyrata]|uniref:Predicted protein n=1 Tax=Arabidopsis lyrata subsp. lyrata TaxID=81972 RepID=D7LCP6_ARALL|nr:predicted protein [Arabidopsis lyrata subsp. lyrata]
MSQKTLNVGDSLAPTSSPLQISPETVIERLRKNLPTLLIPFLVSCISFRNLSIKRKRVAKATTVEPGSTEEPSPTVGPSNTTTVEPGSTEEPSPTAIEGEGVEEQQVPGTLSPVLEESDKNEEENSEKNEEEESGEEESEEEDKEEEKEEGNEEGNEEGEESSDDDGSRSLGGESSSDESKKDEIAPENQPENAMGLDDTVNSLDKRVKSLEAFREVQKVDKRKDQEEKNQEKDGDPEETTQEKDGDPKDTTQEKDGDPQVTKMTTRSKRQLG